MSNYVFNSKLKRSKDLMRQYKEKESLNPSGLYTRHDLVEPFDDDPLKGILYVLKYRKKSNSKQMELLILTCWRQINDLINKRLLKNKWIRENVLYYNGGKYWYSESNRWLKEYMMYSDYKDLPLNKLYTMVTNSLDESSSSGKFLNGSEDYIDKNILNVLAKGEFIATANDYSVKIGPRNRRPDWINYEKGIIIEYQGHRHAPPYIREPSMEIHIMSRIDEYEKLGYECFIITFHDLISSYTENIMIDQLKIFLEKHNNRVFEDEVNKIKKKQFENKYTKDELEVKLAI